MQSKGSLERASWYHECAYCGKKIVVGAQCRRLRNYDYICATCAVSFSVKVRTAG